MKLATLVVMLEAQTAQFMSGFQAANARIDKFENRMSKFGVNLRRIVAGVSIGAAFHAVIKATEESEKAFALLENAVQATGKSAGYTAEQLAQMAGDLQKLTTFDDEAIMGMQQLLLRFKSIQGVRFEGAQKAVLDLATALSLDLGAAAKLVGKALEDPVKGMKQLARSGVVLSEGQQRVIKDLVETGQKAKAQEVLLKQLEARYGGAAAAAKNTFGGALTGLKNSFNDLLEGKGGMQDATTSINALTETLNSEDVKKGFETIISGMAKVIEFSAKAAAGIAGFAKSIGESFAKMGGASTKLNDDALDISEIPQRIKELEKLKNDIIFAPQSDFYIATKAVDEQNKKSIDSLDRRIAALKKQSEILKSIQAPVSPSKAPKGGTPGEDEDMDVYDPKKDKALADVNITARKIDIGPMEQYYRDLERLSKTDTQRKLEQFAEVESALDELLDAGRINAEQYNKAWGEAFDELVPKVEVTAKKLGDSLTREFDKMSEFMKEASRNVQDILGAGIEDVITDGFEKGGKNALKSFETMLIRMAAQAVAADIAGKIFGTGGVGSGGGWLGTAAKWLGGIFGGSRDQGGRGRPGQAYLIGTGAQPEMFVPDRPGTFVPAGAMGAVSVTQIINVTGSVDQRTARQMQLETSRRQRVATARLG